VAVIPFLDRRFQPQLDQPQHAPVYNATSYRFQKLVMWNRIEVAGQIGVDHVGVAPAYQPAHFFDRVHRFADGAVAVTLSSKSASKLGPSGSWGAFCPPRPRRVGMPRGRSPPPGFEITPRRTGSGRYVFEISSSRRPASHSSKPDASIAAKLIPSTPAAPALNRVSA